MSSKALVKSNKRQDVAATRHSGNTFENLFEDMWSFPLSTDRNLLSPKVDMRETPKELVVTAELPGMDKNNIKLNITDNTLTISSEKSEEKTLKYKNGQGQEHKYNMFYRSFGLPAAVKTTGARAVYKNGVLTVTLPKEKASKTHRVNVS